jgi:CdiI immunity protein
MIKDKFPNLYQFFGGYFHEDWDLEAKDAEAVIHNYLNDDYYLNDDNYLNDEKPRIVKQVIDEISLLLEMNLDRYQLSDVLADDLRCSYDPTFYGISDIEWLRWVQATLKHGIETKMSVTIFDK